MNASKFDYEQCVDQICDSTMSIDDRAAACQDLLKHWNSSLSTKLVNDNAHVKLLRVLSLLLLQQDEARPLKNFDSKTLKTISDNRLIQSLIALLNKQSESECCWLESIRLDQQDFWLKLVQIKQGIPFFYRLMSEAATSTTCRESSQEKLEFFTNCLEKVPSTHKNEHSSNLLRLVSSNQHFKQNFQKNPQMLQWLLDFLVESPSIALLISQLDQDDCPIMWETCAGLLKTWISNSNQEKALALTGAMYAVSKNLGSNLLEQTQVFSVLEEILNGNNLKHKISALKVLNEFCVDAKGRKAVYSSNLMQLIEMEAEDAGCKSQSALAMSILVKLHASNEFNELFTNSQLEKNLTFLMKSLSPDWDPLTIDSSLETLVFLTLKPSMKQTLSKLLDIPTLCNICSVSSATKHYQLASIFFNLTSYQERMTEEQQTVQKLMEMSKQSVPLKDDQLESNEFVDERCIALVNKGVVRALVELSSSPSDQVQSLVARTFLNLSRRQENRGFLVQQGMKALIHLVSKGPEASRLVATQAVARIAISMDPRVAFNQQTSLALVGSFINFCRSMHELQQFEGLMALTNFASVDSLRSKIHQSKGLKVIENLMLSDNKLVQRAAVEAICNMCYDSAVFDGYSRDSKSIGIFVALCDAEDYGCRRAAAGIIATMSCHPNTLLILSRDHSRFERMISGLLDEPSDEILLRALTIMHNTSLEHLHLIQSTVSLVFKFKTHKNKDISALCAEILQNNKNKSN